MNARIARILCSLRVRLVLLVTIALIPVMALFLYRGVTERREAAQYTRHAALRLAHVVSEREQQLLEGAHQALRAIAQIPAVRDGDRDDCRHVLARLLAEYDTYLNIGVIDLDGSVRCSALPFSPDTDLSDRSYFRLAVENDRFAVGEYQVGRITGQPSINFGLPIHNPDGSIRAVVFAAMDLSWLRRMAAVSAPPDGTIFTVIDGNGTILARSVDPAVWVGTTVPARLRDLILAAPRDKTMDVEDLDGVERLCAVTTLNRSGAGQVYLSVAVPTDTVYAALDDNRLRELFALFSVLMLSLLAAWFGGNFFVARRVHRLVHTTTRLAAGDLDARARDEMDYGRDEIGELARVFDGMAEAMKQRAEALNQTQNDLMSAVEATIEGWARALERRDSDTQGHTRRVAELSTRLARAMGVPEGDIVHIRRGALLHDIGKMGIPDSILLKPGPLTDEEWRVMRRHPTYAYEWLSHIPLLKPALEIPYAHHERWDGSGYPRGLVGEQIPLAARIFAVVDVFDGVTSDRPYRDAWSEDRAIAYLRENAGRLFDARIVDAFIRLKMRKEPEAEVVYRRRKTDRTPDSEVGRKTPVEVTTISD